MNIVPNKLSLAQLFANTNEQFVVPSYQRRYSWKVQHTGALFDDIDLLKDNDGHLFGMIILHAGAYNGGFMTPELVDGQQRLTTLTILLKSIEKAYRKIEKDETANEIRKMLLSKGPDKILRNKLILGDLDCSDYETIMIDGDIEEIENKHLKEAIEYFDYWLSEYTEEELDYYYHKLINVAVIIRLDVTLAQDAYKLFETINNRGLKLSATDIIKNFLLGHASKINDNTTLEQVKSIWAQIITELDGINTDNFFRQYFCSVLKRKITFNGLVEEFKTYYIKNVKNTDLLGEFEVYADTSSDLNDEEEAIFENGDDQPTDEGLNENEEQLSKKVTIIDFLKQIRNASEVYRKMCYEEFNEKWINIHITNLWRIQCFPSFIFLMHFFQKQYSRKTQITVLKMIETFMLRRHICERRTAENDYIFSHLMNSLEENTEDEMLHVFRRKIMDYYPEDSDFEDKLPTYQFKGKVENRARYMLEQLEYEKRGNTKETVISTSEDVHLEHIVPQTINTKKAITEFGDWISYLGEKALVKHKKYVRRIGNLTLLAAPLNIQASNNPFTRKKSSYRLSDLLITKDLATKSDFKFYHIDQRGEQITKKALGIWKIDFSDILEE
ncbi:MAG: DUF262 domain-containing protein [Bacteroidota bacterium]